MLKMKNVNEHIDTWGKNKANPIVTEYPNSSAFVGQLSNRTYIVSEESHGEKDSWAGDGYELKIVNEDMKELVSIRGTFECNEVFRIIESILVKRKML